MFEIREIYLMFIHPRKMVENVIIVDSGDIDPGIPGDVDPPI